MAAEDGRVRICQQEIVKLDLEIQAGIQDVRECGGPVEILQDLNQDIRQKIQQAKSCIEELECLGQEQDRETDKILLLKEAEKHKKQLASRTRRHSSANMVEASCVSSASTDAGSSVHTDFESSQVVLRSANMACQLAIQRQEKERLMGGEASEPRHRGRSNKENMAKTSAGITESLMGVSRLLSAQVQRSEDTMSSLVTSSRQVSDTHEEFKNMSGHIQNSRKLLTKYGRRECTDKLLILLALVFFFATVLYIMKKRLF